MTRHTIAGSHAGLPFNPLWMEEQHQIVGRHGARLLEPEPPLFGGRRKVLDPAKTPIGIAPPKVLIERKIAWRSRHIIIEPGSVEDQRSARRKHARRAVEQTQRCAPRTD